MFLRNFSIVVFLLSSSITTAELRAGAAKVDLVPPFPTTMGGYFDRVATFEGVSTPIFARSVFFDNGETQVGVIAVDLVYVSRLLVDAARENIEKATGVPGENILISATHSHSGPSGFIGARFLGRKENSELSKFLIQQVTTAGLQAYKNLESAQIGFGKGRLDTMTRNRQQNNNEVIDPDVGVLKVQKKDSREMIATLANFTGHPVILGGNNLLVSCEYPGVACTTVENVLGGVAIFTQGACGDVTMHRSGDPFEEVNRIGRVVGAEIIKTSEQTRVGDESTLFSHFQDLKIAPRDIPSPEEAKANQATRRKAYEDAEKAGKPDYILKDLRREISASNTTASVANRIAENPIVLEKAQDSCLQVMQIGPLVLVGIPAEMFVEYALEMKTRVQQDVNRPMMLVGYANDYAGYIITPRADRTGGYEKAISRVAPSAGRTMTETAMGIVQEHIRVR
jgi:hypothetical protein